MKEIRVKLNEVLSGQTVVLDDVLPKEDIGMADDDIVHVDGDVKVHGEASVTDKTLLINAVFSGAYSSECGRCLEEVRQPFRHKVLLDFDISQVKDSIDVAEDFRQEIVTVLPLQLLCREDCRGLCPVCGANLNEKMCEHQK